MNKLILLTLIFNSIIFSQSDIEKFLQGNIFYKDNQFEKAIDLYQSIDNKNSHIWFNIGNSYYKLGKMAEAKVAFLRARKNARLPDLKNIDYNMNQLNQKLNINDDSSRLEIFFGFISKYMSVTSFVMLQFLFLVLWFLGNLFLIKLIKTKKYALLLILIFVTFTFLVCLMIKYFENNRKVGVIAIDNYVVLAGPDKNYHQIGSLKFCNKIIISKEFNGWLKVSKSDLTGWIPSKIGEKNSNSVLVV